MRLRVYFAVVAVAGPLVACRQKPAVVDRSDLVNNGVDIVPKAVLAASESMPTTLPAALEDQPDLIQTISDSQQKHYELIEVIRNSGLLGMLQTKGDFTLLAPTDQAFGKLPPGTLQRLLLPENHTRLLQLMQYHLIRGRISESELLETNGTVTTCSGLPVTIRGIDGKVVINDANVIKTTTSASNGNIFWIDTCLDPDFAPRP